MKIYSLIIFIVGCFSSIAEAQPPQTPITEGKASYYAKKFQGRKTAGGEYFDNSDFTAAHRSYPFGTYLNVRNKKNNANVIVRVNDRGPFVKGRIIDLSEAAARRIGGYHAGVIPVKVEVINLLKHTNKLDSIYSSTPIVDCFGNESSPSGFLLSLWSTNDLIHAIYTANDFYLKENVYHVYICNKKLNDKIEYYLVVGDIADKSAALQLKAYYEKKGFMKVTFFDL